MLKKRHQELNLSPVNNITGQQPMLLLASQSA